MITQAGHTPLGVTMDILEWFLTRSRERVGLDLYEAAEKLQANPLYIESLEDGSLTTMTADFAETLCQVYGISVDALIQHGTTIVHPGDHRYHRIAMCVGRSR